MSHASRGCFSHDPLVGLHTSGPWRRLHPTAAISATERFEGEMTRKEALEALTPNRAEASPAPRAEPESHQAADPPRRERRDR